MQLMFSLRFDFVTSLEFGPNPYIFAYVVYIHMTLYYIDICYLM